MTVIEPQHSWTTISKLSVKGELVNALGFVGPRVSVQLLSSALSPESSHRHHINKEAWLSSNKTLFTRADQEVVGQPHTQITAAGKHEMFAGRNCVAARSVQPQNEGSEKTA